MTQKMTDKQALKLALTALETLGMLLWYEPETRKYRVMKYEDELMEVVE